MQKTAYEITVCLEFRRVVFRSDARFWDKVLELDGVELGVHRRQRNPVQLEDLVPEPGVVHLREPIGPEMRVRSEERRAGKKGTCGGSPLHQKDKANGRHEARAK